LEIELSLFVFNIFLDGNTDIRIGGFYDVHPLITFSQVGCKPRWVQPKTDNHQSRFQNLFKESWALLKLSLRTNLELSGVSMVKNCTIKLLLPVHDE
jgi:hypothetical protein